MTELLDSLSPQVPANLRDRWRAELDRLDRFSELLLRWNRVHNLTTVSDAHGVAVRHLLDSAIGLALTQDRQLPDRQVPKRVLDVGSGGGLPGVVWAILSDAEITCVDKVRKKTSFLLTAKRELQLDRLSVECADAFSLQGDWDLITSRATLSGDAVARLRDLGPRLALFLGPSSDLAQLTEAMKPWDFETTAYTLPGVGERWMGFAQLPG